MYKEKKRVSSDKLIETILISAVFLLLVILPVLNGLNLFSETHFTGKAVSAICGNGLIEQSEQCDDGNVNNGDGCTASCAVEEQCYDIGNTFSFIQVSDSYSGSGNSGVMRALQDATNKRGVYPGRVIPRFMVIGGDWTNFKTTDTSLINVVSNLNYPFTCSASNKKFPYFIGAGNHDAEVATGVEWMSKDVGAMVSSTLVGISNFKEGPFDTWGSLPGETDKRTTYSFDYKNAHFVVVNQYTGITPSNPNFASPYSSVACITQPLYDWIDQDLASTNKPIKFVIGHEPAWSFCGNAPGYNSCLNYGNNFVEDYLDPAKRPRPHSPLGTGDWGNSYGEHWGDSLEDSKCPNVNGKKARNAFWEMLEKRNVVAHLIGHSHTYSSRLVEADGKRNKDSSGNVLPVSERNRLAYGKKGEIYNTNQGVWEIDSASIYNLQALYVLITVNNNKVTFETFDIKGTDPADWGRIEWFSVDVLSDITDCTGQTDGTACDDGLFCTTGDACLAGLCQGGTARDCSSSNDQCNTGKCNELSDICEKQAANEGLTCVDNNLCTTADICSVGVCRGSSVSCSSDGIACTIESCIPGTGCASTPNNALCNSGEICDSLKGCIASTARVFYADNSLTSNCIGSYDPVNRACGSGSSTAYATLANAASAANTLGDIVIVKPGTYNEVLKPTTSGINGKPITFKAEGTVVLTGTARDNRAAAHPSDPNLDFGPIWLEEVQFIVIDGFEVVNGEGYVRSVRAHNNTLKNNHFRKANNGWIQASYFFESHDNKILNNIIEDGSDSVDIIHSDRNVIEGNTFLNARHTQLALKCSSYNIIRNNRFDNKLQKSMEIFDCESETMFNYYNTPYYVNSGIFDSTRYNLVENNSFVLTSVVDTGDGPYNQIQFAGQNTIIRNNLFYNGGGIGIDETIYSTEAEHTKNNRIYNNVFYNIRGGGIVTAGLSGRDFSDNIHVNNIFYKNYPMALKWADNFPSGTQATHKSMNGFEMKNNILFNNIAGESDLIYVSYNNRRSLNYVEDNYPAFYKGNLEVDPLFKDVLGYDFNLLANSPAIDAGDFLTITVGSGSGTSVVVKDSLYFYVGDLIQLDDSLETARIVSINRATNTLILDSSLSWSDKKRVSLAYSGNAPDIGAYEYNKVVIVNCVDIDHDGIIDYDSVQCPSGKDLCTFTNNYYFYSKSNELNNYIPSSSYFESNFSFNASNLFNYSNFALRQEGIARVSFLKEISLIKINENGCFEKLDFNLGKIMKMEKKKFFLNSSHFSGFNKPARITFYNVTDISTPKILKDKQTCSDCSIIAHYKENGTIVVEVSGFSEFEIVEDTGGSGGGSGGGSSGGGSSGFFDNPFSSNNKSSCKEKWECSPWSVCIDETQNRTCKDSSNCSTYLDLPKQVQGCFEISNNPVVSQLSGKKNILILAAVFLFWIIFVSFLIFYLKKYKNIDK